MDVKVVGLSVLITYSIAGNSFITNDNISFTIQTLMIFLTSTLNFLMWRANGKVLEKL